MSGRFCGKVALVTGGAAGIGAAIVRRLLAEGATVIAGDLKLQNFDDLLKEIPFDHRERLQVLALDVSDEAAIEGCFRSLGPAIPGLDVLVNNAGSSLLGGITEIEPAAWTKTLTVDLTSVFLMSRTAMPLLRNAKGNIVNIASISGLFADHRMAAYNAAKAGVINLTRSIALDYGSFGIRANVVAPGPVFTPALAHLLAEKPELRELWEDGTPLGRIADPADIASAVAFLSSEDARHISGVVLPVDGAFTVKTGQPNLTETLNGTNVD